MSGRLKARLLVQSAILGLATLPAAALAQTPAPAPTTAEPDGGVAEIVVTAQRRAENLQNVPIAVTALGSEQLAQAVVRDTSDLKSLAPSLNFTTAVGGFGLPRIRGVGSTGTGPGIENPVATYIDGVYISSSTGAMMSLNDVQQVAVLKGPQGTLFGRNATGGLIQITTRRPTKQFTADFTGTYGNYDSWGGSAYVSGGLTDGIAANVAFKYDDRNDGFGVNTRTGTAVQTERSYAGRAKILWEMGADTIATLAGDIADVKSVNPAFRPSTRNIRGNLAAGGARDIDADIDPSLRSEQRGASLTLQHEFPGVQLMSISAYRKMKLRVRFDPDGTTEDEWVGVVGESTNPALANQHAFVIDNNQIDKQFTQEVQLLSTHRGPFKWVLGGFYMWSDGKYDPAYSITRFQQVRGQHTELFAEQSLKSWAAFAQASHALTDATNLTGGIRYTRDRRHAQGQRVTVTDATGAETLVGTPFDARDTFPKATWRVSLDHRFTPGIMAYASYNRGFRSAAYVVQNIGQTTATVADIILKPEIVDAYEVGLKTDLFDRRVRFNIAAYHYDQKNVQVMQIESGVQKVYNADGAKIDGVDADITVKPVRELTLTGGFNYVHGRYKGFTRATLATPRGSSTACPIVPNLFLGGNCLIIGDASGSRLQNVPDWTATIGATYDLATSVGRFTIGGNYYYNDGFLVDPGNRVRQGHYELVDASVTWRSLGDRFSIQLWGKNLTNQFYTQQFGASNFSDNYVAAAPRTYGVTAGFHF